MYKKILFIFLNYNFIFGMAELGSMAVQILSESMAKMAAVKMATEGYKQELVAAYQLVNDLVEKDKVKNANIILLSLIKDFLIKKMEFNKNSSSLVVNPLSDLVGSSYKKLISAINILKKKFNQLLVKNKNNNSVILKIGLLIIKNCLYEYLLLLKKYNYQLQNVSQIIQAGSNFNSLYTEIDEGSGFIDEALNSEASLLKLDDFLKSIDEKSDLLLRSKNLLYNNNSILFVNIINDILRTINNAIENESNKDINNQSTQIFDLKESIQVFQNKLFALMDQFEDGSGEAQSILYKTIALLNISHNKIIILIEYYDKIINDQSYNINNFVNDLYKNFLNTKENIKKNKNKYLQVLNKNNIGFLDLVDQLKKFIAFLIKNNKELDFNILSVFLNSANETIFKYSNEIGIKYDIINKEIMFLSYINGYLLNTKENAIKFQNNKNSGSLNNNSILFKTLPSNDFYEKIYNKNDSSKKNKINHGITAENNFKDKKNKNKKNKDLDRKELKQKIDNSDLKERKNNFKDLKRKFNDKKKGKA